MIAFKSNVPLELRPVRAVLKESVSDCYSLVLDVFATDDSIDPTKALNQDARVELAKGDGDNRQSRTIRGVITEMSLAGVIQEASTPGLQSNTFWYQLVLVPHLALLDRTQRSRVFCTELPRKVGNVIQEVLGNTEDFVLPQDVKFEIAVEPQYYRDLDMIVQYQETDFAFLSRLAEHSGIFYFFDERAGKQTIVFADLNTAFPWLNGTAKAKLWYQRSAGTLHPGYTVRSAKRKTHLATKNVKLSGWSYTDPKTSLDVGFEDDPHGVGLLDLGGSEGYQDADWGQALAQIRAEEANVDKVLLEARTDCVSIAAGTVFYLDNHPDTLMNHYYIVVSAEHHAWQSAPGIDQLPGPGLEGDDYWNNITAIPLETPFRPRRRTPRPHLPGLMRAVVDGVDPARANIDGLGCYRIRFPFDTRNIEAGKASCPVRLITPYGGPKEGLHFPLRAGSEVMIAFENGDPDRPVIVGPLYDDIQKSMVTTANRTANVICTATGIRMTMNDGKAVKSELPGRKVPVPKLPPPGTRKPL